LQRLRNSVGGVYERIEYADFETKKDSNRNDEAEITQSEIHRSGADDGAEPGCPRRCSFTDAAACRVTPAAVGCASGVIDNGASLVAFGC
jgi:hypothetical protein